ncbi:MAG: hypothetical protein H0T42_20765 [Deltaproteobacteria bacterium]|nr:hypothetical protein [Deltaproteobacteria bacterium]
MRTTRRPTARAGSTDAVKFPASKGVECASPKLFDFSVDAADGKGVLVLLHTRDGKTIEALQLPLWK